MHVLAYLLLTASLLLYRLIPVYTILQPFTTVDLALISLYHASFPKTINLLVPSPRDTSMRLRNFHLH